MAATPLYADPTQIPVGPSMMDNVAIRRILNLLNNRLGSALNAGNGFPLTSSVSAGGFGINNIGGLGVPAGFPTRLGVQRELWISAGRGDNTSGVNANTPIGSGLQEDPIDVSTPAKMDVFFGILLPAMGPGIHIRYLPGTYKTYGAPRAFSSVNRGYNLPGGNWYDGSGAGITIIQQYALPDNGQICMMQNLVSVNNAYTRVTNMTFDANWQNLSGGAPTTSVANGIELNGDFCEIDHWEMINGYSSFANGQEGFHVKISSYTAAGIAQSFKNPKITNGRAYNNRGDYGSAIAIFCATASAPLQCNAIIANNHVYGYNGGTSNIVCTAIGFTGDGFDIYGNVADTCNCFIYNEGNVKNFKIHDNTAVNCLTAPIRFQIAVANESDYISIYNNNFEISTIPVKAGSNATKYGIGYGTTAGTTNGKMRIYGNNITRKLAGVASSTVARSGTTVTVVTAANHNLATGELIEVSGFTAGNAPCNTDVNTPVQATVTNATTFTYTSSTTGTITVNSVSNGLVYIKTAGISIGMATPDPVDVYDNKVDDNLYNVFVSPFPGQITYFNNFTFTGYVLLLDPNTQNALAGSLTVPITNVSTFNGNSFLKAQVFATRVNPNSALKSATNKFTLFCPAATYDLGSQTYSHGVYGTTSNFISVVGLGHREDVVFTSSSHCFSIDIASADFRWAHLSINTSSAVATTYGLNRTVAASAVETMEDVILNGAGTLNSIRHTSSTNAWSGTYRYIWFKNGGFFAMSQGTFSGTAEYITIGTPALAGAPATDNVFIASGARVSHLTCWGQLNLFANNGVLEYGTVKTTQANTDAILELSNATGAGGSTRFCNLISNGTGAGYKNSGGARHTCIYNCAMNVAIDVASITNDVLVPNNTVDSDITQ